MFYPSIRSRRQMLREAAALAGMLSLNPLSHIFAAYPKQKYSIGACDWSIGRRSDTEALGVAKEIGLDGVQVSLGNVNDNLHLRQKSVQQRYKQASKKYGVEIYSLAIGELNRVPYKSAPETEVWVRDSIDAAKALGCKVILLAFFNKGDLKEDEAGRQEVIRRLKKVVPKAEKAGVILGIESLLSADEHLAIIDAVGSKNVRIYYDVANSHKMGYNIYEEMERLGNEYICEVYAKEKGSLLGQGKIDFPRVKQILDDINYDGWVIIEASVPNGADMLESYQANNRYLRKILNT